MTRSGSPPRDALPVNPADRARVFTVTLRDDPALAVCGRLTHVASGAAAHFDSAEELVAMLRALGRPA